MDSTVAVDQPAKKKLVAPALGRSDTSIIKEFLGERRLYDQAEVPRTGGSIIKEFLGERNLLGQAGAPRSGGGSAGGSACASLAQKEPTASSGSVEKSVASRVPREPFSDSSWLDKFLDERDRELDTLDSEDEQEEEAGTGAIAFDGKEPVRVPRAHLIGRPASIAAEEFVGRHKKNLEQHFNLDYQDWTSNALQPARAEAVTGSEELASTSLDPEAGECEQPEIAPPESLDNSLEILTDDFDSSSACSSAESLSPKAAWAGLASEIDKLYSRYLDLGSEERAVDPDRATRKGAEQATGAAQQGHSARTVDEAVAFESESEPAGLTRSSAIPETTSGAEDRTLYSEAVRAAEQGESQGRQRMEAVVSATGAAAVAASQGAAMRMNWRLTFANQQLEDAYRLAHIANGGDADYLCAVLKIWFSVLHIYMLGRQFSIMKEIRWGWIAISAPGKRLLSTSLEWNVVGLLLMMVFLFMHLRWRTWWSKNRLLLLSLYLGTVWALEVWYILGSQDAWEYRMVRALSPSLFMSFMYNVPFVLHMKFRAAALAAQLGALTVRRDYALVPWVVLFHVVSSAVTFFLDRRSRLTFVKSLPPWLLIPGTAPSQSALSTQVTCSNYMWKIFFPDNSNSQQRVGSAPGGGARKAYGPGYFAEGQQGVGLRGHGTGESSSSSPLEARLRERLRQRRTSLGGFAGGFAGVGGVKTANVYGERLAQEMQAQQSTG